jgi:Ecdysteroid kinase-like family
MTDVVKDELGKLLFGNLQAALEKSQGYDKVVGEKLGIFANSWASKAEEIFRSDGKFCVLSHSDFHFKNAMYKYQEDGSLDDILLVRASAPHC